MKLPSSLLREFASAANQNEEKTNNNAYGTVQISNNQTYVRLDGSDILMPVNSVSNVRNGDRVMVVIENHTATITGNVTSPSATNKDLSELANRVNGKNKVIYSGKEPDGMDFAVGDTWFNTSDEYTIYVWDGSNWSQAELGQNAIAANAIRAKHIYSGSVTADKIAANAVTADKIRANSVTVDKLVVGDMSNLATVNENDPNSMVTTPASLATSWAVISQTTGLRGIIKADASQTQIALSQHQIPNFFAVGDELYYSIRVRAISTARSIGIRVAAYNAEKTLLGSVGKTISITTTFALYTGTISIADGSTWAWANAVYYTLYISDPNGAGDQLRIINAVVGKKSTGNMLVDGTITADKLSADAIDGKTITGATIRTPAGTGWEMIHVENPPAGHAYFEEPMPGSSEDTYMNLQQDGLKSLNLSNTIRSLMASVRLKLYNGGDSASQLIKTIYGWYLKDMVYAPVMYTENGEVATIAPNKSGLTISLTPINIGNFLDFISPWTTLGGCWYYKVGTRVHLHIAVTGLTADTNTNICVMEGGFRPYGTIVAAGRGSTGSDFASMWVASNGTVTIRSTTTNAVVDIEYDAFN